jgi:hypothetical protein
VILSALTDRQEKHRRPDAAGGAVRNTREAGLRALVQTGTGAQALDFVLYLQLATLQLGYSEPVARRMTDRVSYFIFQRTVPPFQFRKMRLQGHVGWLLRRFRQHPSPRSLCHVNPGKSIIDNCALR